MDNGLGQAGVLQVTPPAALEQQLSQQATAKAAANAPPVQDMQPLAGYIKAQFEIFRNHRNSQSGWTERLLSALRIYNGQYDSSKISEIKKFGGSEIYVRLIAQKCRAASSLLRDIYLSQDQPWALRPPAAPEVPENIVNSINQLLQSEEQMVQQTGGQPPNPTDVDKRKRALLDEAGDAAKKKAAHQARDSEDQIETMLRDGGFYHALAEFLVDLPIFPFGCIKGPVVRVIPTVTWPKGGGQPVIKHTPKLTWERVSPFDLWWTPGVSNIANANTIEKMRVTRAEINEMLDLPGYDVEQLRMVLDEYGRGGLYDNWDSADSERAVLESRENPATNRSGLIAMMEFNGNVQGRLLQDYGLAVPDELRDYHVQVWVIGSHVIKAHLSPSPRQRHPYFVTSFEKVPGTPIGNGLTDLLTDMQEAANATFRSLVNNLSISSGPQVVVADDRLSSEETGEDLYAWKRWHVRNDPVGNNAQPPISFFQPQSNVQELIAAFSKFVDVADDVSAIPKYVGGQAGSGAGRTASGLAMLMGNASKILQTVSANIDRDVLEEALLQLQDLILLTDTSGLLTGEEKVSVQGVNVAIQRETLRQRQIEFLSATINPLDQKIMGIKGRAAVLRSVSTTIGMTGEDIVPSEDQIEKMHEAEMKKDPQQQAIERQVEEGIAAGVKAGVARISTELTAGVLAQRAQMPEGKPTHIGTLAGEDQGQPKGPATNNPGMDLGRAAAQGQGTKPSPTSNASGPITDVVGHPKGPGAHQVSGGVG